MPRWYMAEKKIDYQYHDIDVRNKKNLDSDYLNINPFGKLPALRDDSNDLIIFESGAILQYLSENYTQEIINSQTRASISQWILFANSTLAIALFVPTNKQKEFPRLMTVLDSIYANSSFLVGDIWTAADCAVSAYLSYLPIFFPNEDLSSYPSIQNLITTTRSNENYKAAMGIS